MKKLFNCLFIFLLISVEVEASSRRVKNQSYIDQARSLFTKKRIKTTLKYLSIPLLTIAAAEIYFQLKHEKSLLGLRKPNIREYSDSSDKEPGFSSSKNNSIKVAMIVSGVSVVNVLQQGDGGSCAYHALKNVVCVMNRFKSYEPTDVTSQDVYDYFYKDWSKIISDQREVAVAKSVYKRKVEERIERLKELRTRRDKRLLEKMEKNSQEYKNYQEQIAVQNQMIAGIRLPEGVDWLGGGEIEALVKNSKSSGLIDRSLRIDVCDGAGETARSVAAEINGSQDGLWGNVWNDTARSHWVGLVVRKVAGKHDIYFMNSRKNDYKKPMITGFVNLIQE